MTCESCGRDSGHFIGCAEIAAAISDDQCARAGCENLRAPQGKGPRPKYCDEHKTGSKS